MYDTLSCGLNYLENLYIHIWANFYSLSAYRLKSVVANIGNEKKKNAS